MGQESGINRGTAETRDRIIESARRLFNRDGFDRVTIDSIMAGAGLTRGAFYTYFETKSDLYAEALSCFLTDGTPAGQWEGISVDLEADDAATQIVRAYLSRQHLEQREHACPMVALPSDVSRADNRAKKAYETVFREMAVRLMPQKGQPRSSRPPDRETALAIAALCVGAMTVARAVEDRHLADDLRDACLRVALSLGGWKQRAGRSRGSRTS